MFDPAWSAPPGRQHRREPDGRHLSAASWYVAWPHTEADDRSAVKHAVVTEHGTKEIGGTLGTR